MPLPLILLKILPPTVFKYGATGAPATTDCREVLEERQKIGAHINELTAQKESLETALAKARTDVNRDLLEEIRQYEDVLSALMSENDGIKRQIIAMTAMVYDPERELDTPVCDILMNLLHAIRLQLPSAHSL